MLAGLGVLVISAVAPDRTPLAWARAVTLLIVCGAVVELLAVHQLSREARTQHKITPNANDRILAVLPDRLPITARRLGSLIIPEGGRAQSQSASLQTARTLSTPFGHSVVG
jgi:hypothetical protein